MADFDQFWNYSKPEETFTKFQQILNDYQQNPALYAELLTQLARCQSLQSKFSEAHIILDQVINMLNDSMPVVQIRYRLERGRSFNSAGQKDDAIPYFLEAWKLAQEAGEDFYAVDALHMLAIASDADEQLSWHSKAIAYAEQSQSERARGWLGSLYNNLGWTLFDLGKYAKALTVFEKALAFRTEQKQAENVRIAWWCIAKTQRFLGKPKEALELLHNLESEYKTLKEPSGYVYEEIAECLLSLNDPKAKTYFAKAYSLLAQDRYLHSQEPDRLERLAELSS